MNARRRQQLRVGVCLGLPALAIALCAVLGLGATAGAHPVADHHPGHAAMAPAPYRTLPAIMRMQDPIGFDVIVAEHAVRTSHAADPASAPAAPARVSVEPGSAHSRGPPGGERV